jgi:hypothetical protein
MPKKKKAASSTKGAKIATLYEGESLSPISVEINGFIYTSHGSSRLDSLADAVEAHVDEDREFKDQITLIQAGYYNEIIYAPTILCLLGYLDRSDLYGLLVGDIVDGIDDGNTE